MLHHWGFVISTGALLANNTLNLDDIGAIWLLADEDSLGVSEAINISGLIPVGSGLSALTEGMGRVYLGGPFGGHFALGFSAGLSEFGSFQIDDRLISLIRDGNQTQETFAVGETSGAGLLLAEYGAHATLRLNPLGSDDGARITLGGGARLVKPIFYGSGASLVPEGGVIRVTNSSSVNQVISARVNYQAYSTPEIDGGSVSDYLNRGSGVAADFLARVEWPTSGFAAEIMVANIGSVDIQGVERRVADIDVSGATFNDVFDALQDSIFDQFGTFLQKDDTLSFDVQDTVDVSITLPRILRFTASAWANRILQIDISATAPVTTDVFETPVAVDIGTTWRFSRVIPLRLGLMLGGSQGVGYTGGLAIEGRNFLMQFTGGTLGGLFGKAKGVGGRFELGILF
jgi:hypothetical protein